MREVGNGVIGAAGGRCLVLNVFDLRRVKEEVWFAAGIPEAGFGAAFAWADGPNRGLRPLWRAWCSLGNLFHMAAMSAKLLVESGCWPWWVSSWKDWALSFSGEVGGKKSRWKQNDRLQQETNSLPSVVTNGYMCSDLAVLEDLASCINSQLPHLCVGRGMTQNW